MPQLVPQLVLPQLASQLVLPQLVPGMPRRTHQSKSAGASRGEAAGRPSKRAQD